MSGAGVPKIDGADYALIDSAFNSQGGTVLSRPGGAGAISLAGPASDRPIVTSGISDAPGAPRPFIATEAALDVHSIGYATQSVPEPSLSAFAMAACVGLMSRTGIRSRRRALDQSRHQSRHQPRMPDSPPIFEPQRDGPRDGAIGNGGRGPFERRRAGEARTACDQLAG